MDGGGGGVDVPWSLSLHPEAKECERKYNSFQTSGANVKKRDGTVKNVLS